MHELSVCLALIDQVERIARERDAATVCEIVISLGQLSGVEPQLLRHAYPLAATGTVAEHAQLTIEASELVIRCTVCEAESRVPANRLLCGACGDFRTRVVSGDEMVLQRVEFIPAKSVGKAQRATL